MAKTKTAYFCQNCGTSSPKWIGKCNSCGEWNTYVEEIVETASKAPAWQEKGERNERSAQPRRLDEITLGDEQRTSLPDQELTRVLGGGIVPGSVTLVGGEPGIGKSTLMLQVALSLGNMPILYVSGEESEQQIRMRAERLGALNTNCLILTETDVDAILRHASSIQPGLIVIDSIQTLQTSKVESSAGSVTQIRECTAELIRFAKMKSIPVMLIGHITKEGQIAGPKVLEHMVDTVLQFEGDRHHIYRILRATKNRFGSTAEIGIYEMQGAGLIEVNDPSDILISQREERLSGTAICATLEGIRPLLVEAQALVSSAVYGTPQRSATGFDLRRLNMLLAVLEKRCGFKLGAKDVFLNMAGGLRVEDPAIDLGILCAVLSSSEDQAIPTRICFAGEVGLSGEIRPVTRVEQRISEASKLGFKQLVLSKYNMKGLDRSRLGNIELIPVARVDEVFDLVFANV